MHSPTWRMPALALSVLLLFGVDAASAQAPPGACEDPARKGTSEVGCYLTATHDLGALPPGPMYWHLYNYPSLTAADSVKGPRGTAVEAFGKVWLYTIAEQTWRPPDGERIAVIGPLPTVPGKRYTARYMEAIFTPGMHAGAHRHSGPEAWYVISGIQCLETPAGITVAHAGQSALVPEGSPMALSSVGTETRRSVLLVLHDASQPWVSMAHDWQPKGLCPK
jgi:quercetin dioxygenase-like cupin family protein